MDVRHITRTRFGGRISTVMADLNARHPWSHNDHFHGWILTSLPERRRAALDVGCGRGELAALLSGRFDTVTGLDVDAGMREQAQVRCHGLENVRIERTDLAHLTGSFDLITMVAVLHHLDAQVALTRVRDLLSPGGRFLAVGLAPPASRRDWAWDLASIVTNPLIGYVKHPWLSTGGPQPPPFPVRQATMSFDEVREVVDAALPGAEMRHRLAFRHTIAWTKPA